VSAEGKFRLHDAHVVGPQRQLLAAVKNPLGEKAAGHRPVHADMRLPFTAGRSDLPAEERRAASLLHQGLDRIVVDTLHQANYLDAAGSSDKLHGRSGV
jgi:hypothetical protein